MRTENSSRQWLRVLALTSLASVVLLAAPAAQAQGRKDRDRHDQGEHRGWDKKDRAYVEPPVVYTPAPVIVEERPIVVAPVAPVYAPPPASLNIVVPLQVR